MTNATTSENGLLERARQELRDRLQFVLVLAIFFPAILESVFKLFPGDMSPEKVSLWWGVVILVLILLYLFIEATKRTMPLWLVSAVDKLLLLEIAFFIPVLYVFAEMAFEDTISFFHAIPFGVSFIGLIVVPLFTLLVLLGYWSYVRIMGMYLDIRSFKNKTKD